MHYIMGKRSFDDVLPELNPVVEKNSVVDIAYHGAVCTDEQIAKLGDYVRLGIISFKFFLNRPEYEWQGITHPDDGMIFEAFERIKGLGGVAAAHCENYEIARFIRKRAESQTANALETWERSRPRFCEALSMSHAIAMAKITGVSLYVVHMSIGEGIDIATKGRIDGADVHLETNCAYLALSKRNAELGILGKVCASDQRTGRQGDAVGGNKERRHRLRRNGPLCNKQEQENWERFAMGITARPPRHSRKNAPAFQ